MTKSGRIRASKGSKAWRGAASLPRGVLDAQLCFALYAASRATTAAYRSPLAELGLTYPRYLVLLALWDQDAVPVSTIGERLFLDFGTLSPLLKKLESDKLIARVRDTTDERVVRAVLTKRGRNLRRSIQRMQSDLACQLDLVPGSVVKLRKQLWMLLQDLMKAGSNVDESHLFNDGHRSRRARGARPLGGWGPRRRADSPEGIRWPRQGWHNKP